eukprot:scaffold410_cov267-Chaetoceros_neogracile.AAC.49
MIDETSDTKRTSSRSCSAVQVNHSAELSFFDLMLKRHGRRYPLCKESIRMKRATNKGNCRIQQTLASVVLLIAIICIQIGRVEAFASSGLHKTQAFTNSLDLLSRIRHCSQEHGTSSFDHKRIICQATSFFDDDESDYEDEDDEKTESSKYKVNDQQVSSVPIPVDAQLQMQQQQKQIDMLMEMVKNQPQIQQQQRQQQQQQLQQPLQSTITEENELLPPPLPGMFDDKGEEELLDTSTQFNTEEPPVAISTPVTYTQGGVAPVVPLKAMLFIDGTWLYYSLYRRKEEFDPIVKKFGKGWQYRYRINWNALPRIVCEQIVGQQINLGWSSSTGIPANSDPNTMQASGQRPVEVVRASVFTSYKKNTDPKSFRVKMYNDMADANYDIHMLESTSNGPEKCVDISLAVEMLHYATVPNAYDVAILLSGDKDFIPAMVRTRQKGRKVGVVSMRTGCNRALYESPHIKDFDVVWIDDFLDRLLVPLPADQVGRTVKSVHDRGFLSAFTITKVILDFASQSPYGKVSSRDVGRYLKNVELPGGTSLLDDVKVGQGGLRRFLQDRMPMVFDVTDRPQYLSRDPNDRSYFIAKKEGAVDFLIEEAKRTKFSPKEAQFLKTYQTDIVEKGVEEDVYYYTTEALEGVPNGYAGINDNVAFPGGNSYIGQQRQQRDPPKVDYSTFTVAQLKEVCKDMELRVTGRKNELIERIIESDERKMMNSGLGKTNDSTTSGNGKIEKYLVDLVTYYIIESRGYASSRDLGRFLATNKGSGSNANSALSELKDTFGGVAAFLNQRSNIFTTVREASDGDPMNYSFGIKLKDPSDIPNVRSNDIQTPAFSSRPAQTLDLKVDAHIEELLREYLHASGGEATSRNIGRYLAANAALESSNSSNNGSGGNSKRNTALKQLKKNYGNLASFLNSKEETFEINSESVQDGSGETDQPSDHSFGVRLR